MTTLAPAEQRCPDGEFRRFNDLVWQATYAAIAAASRQTGLPCDDAQAYTVAAYLDQRTPDGYADHQLYLSLADAHRRQAADTDIPTVWRRFQEDYIDSLPGIRAINEPTSVDKAKPVP